ncbi:N-acetyl-glucosamine transferase [Leucobacter sp. 7(1)]|uniref:glycosyltransferase family 2 protein n=1 Tax=Leucobacter sp. 7(1) TaxID=1255613 RepID=UPI00097F576D|nr:glycosyltransferase family 2 protein [Leucobacter sp. 7(1)]SJN08943.1 N-acetyl-glucosamine transferase [Leucobacter sp. 7(1)]
MTGGIAHAAEFPSFGEILYFLVHLYDGMPVWSIPIYWIALVCILASFISLATLIIRAALVRRARREVDQRTRAESGEDKYLWVFMVPALNEEVTITDSVGRLLEVEVAHKRILVINDGSSDRTGEILASMSAPELTVLTRTPPNAKQGKSEALNDAWRYLHRQILGAGTYAGWDPTRVIVTIVDADGRLDRDAWKVTGHFEDDRVGGVQSQVRIYNRHGFITWAQDLEFGVFGSVFQLGRVAWGTANMGGNGQFNRLAALDSVAVTDDAGRSGPWLAGRLTEDQDIGLRLIHEGWRGAQSSSVAINQQGLHSLRALYRQRTRWSQGAWQVLDRIWPSIRNRNLSFAARVDQLWYLLTPIVQAVVGISVVLSVVFLGFGLYRPQWSIFIIVLFYLFSAGPGIAGVFFTRRRRGIVPFLMNLLLAHLYLVYSWLIYPVVYRALLRQVFGRKSWAKTKREAIAPPAESGAAA